jgi:hypothetical protein
MMQELQPWIDLGCSVADAYSRVFPPLDDEREDPDSAPCSAPAVPPDLRAWMRARRMCADGAGTHFRSEDVGRTIARLERLLMCEHPRTVGTSAKVSAHVVLKTAILRAACGLGFSEIAGFLRVPRSTAHLRYQLHIRELERDHGYARFCRRILDALLEC